MSSFKIAVVRTEAFKISETFIYNQISAFSSSKLKLFYNHRSSGKNIEFFGSSQSFIRFYPQLIIKRLFGIDIGNPFFRHSIKKFKPDALLFHFGTDASLYYKDIQKLSIPVFIFLHGADITISHLYWKNIQKNSAFSYPRTLFKIAALKNVQFICISQRIYNAAIDYGLPKSKLVIKYLGLSLSLHKSKPHPANKLPILLFVGRLVEKKNLPGFLYVYKLLCSKYNLRLTTIVVGDGPDASYLSDFPDVIHLGFVDNKTVRDLMSISKYYLLPSKSASNGDREGLPISVLEALASSCYTYYCSDDNFSEPIIANTLGFYFRSDDLESVAESIYQIEKKSSDFQSLNVETQRYLHNEFDIHTCTSIIENYIKTKTCA